ncbi:MAG: amino acid permease [Desulfobacterales bacterium]|nr:MAG: amino acid permease [Desulfobacterales bacterium]
MKAKVSLNQPRKPRFANKKGNLGTFAGVFTPSILTILGIILFLRLGYVVGNAGLARALIILALANAISVLTSFSLSAIATNLKVKGGGDYYLISRTLGLEFGGAIGIVLFLAQSVSIAFYCIGFGEVAAGMVTSNLKTLPQIIAAMAVALLFILAWLGADWATRFQYVVMSILGAALLSFFIGGMMRWNNSLLVQNWTPPADGLPLWALFAIFFPAVTGFTQGVSMSGDLKDAGQSLPLGTFLAVGLSIVIYFLASIVFAASLPGEVMLSDYGAMKRVAVVDFLISAGVIAATLSSAMASFLGAPRILQSLAGDRVFPFLLPFAKGAGPADNPRRGVLLSTGIALATIALGKLNIIAPVVSMFFLISYGLMNYATFYEARSASPSFRPRFRWFDSRLSLTGALTCLGVMLAIDLTAGSIALAILFAIYQYLKRTAGPARWADSRRSYHLQRIREHLLAAARETEHPRNWRPQLLLFSDDSHRRKRLLHFASWLQGQSGFATVARILEGDGARMLKQRTEAEEELRKDIAENGVDAFPLVMVAPSVAQGIHTLVQAYGIGPLKANTVLLNWFEQPPEGIHSIREVVYGRGLRTAFRFGCNIIVLNAKEDEWTQLQTLPSQERRIDIWWWDDATSHLMLLLAYLITRSEAWEEATIRVLAPCGDQSSDETIEALRQKLDEARIEADPLVIAAVDGDAIATHSSGAALVFLPLRIRSNQPLGPFGEPLADLLRRLPMAALVLAAEDIELDAEPEEGQAGETAAALDALADAEKHALEAEKEAAKASEAATAAQEKLRQIEGAEAETEIEEAEIAEIKSAALATATQAEKATRRAAKARAKAQAAAQAVTELGVEPPQSNPEIDRTTD